MQTGPQYSLKDIINIPQLQSLQEKLHRAFSVPSALVDIDGNELTQVAWQDICARFHRSNSLSKKLCLKSDRDILNQLDGNSSVISYQCPHGLTESASPVIIDKKHLGTFFTGQFFLEKPDIEGYKSRAEKYGYDQKAYLLALEKVPVWTYEKLDQYNGLIKEFLELITGMGYRYLREQETRKAMKENEDRLRFHSEHSPMAVIEWDFDFTISRWTGEAKKIFGWSEKEVLGKNIMDFNLIYEPDIPIVEKVLERLSRGKDIQVISANRNCRKDGSIIHCEWYNTTLKDSNGKMVSVLSQALDVTQRTQSENLIRQSEEKYRLLFQNMITGFALHEIILDESGVPCDYRFLELNPAFELLTGLKAEDLIGRTCREVLPETEAYWFETYGRIALGGKSIIFENYSSSLQKHYQVVAYSPEANKFATIFIDITERKKNEEEKREMAETLSLLNKRLVEISENERALIAREIHDQLGQSLTALKLDTSWLSRNLDHKEESAEKLESMLKQIDSITNDIQRIAAELRPAILDHLGLKAAMEWYSRDFEKRSGIHCALDLENVQFKDENINLALYRILQESLTNIARHAKAKTVQIRLASQRNSIVLEIIDDGVGIEKKKIYSHKSLGFIGIRERAAQYMGSFEISSSPGEETRLTTTIPRPREELHS